MINKYTFFVTALFMVFLISCNEKSDATMETSEALAAVDEDKIIISKKQFTSSSFELGYPEKRTFREELFATGKIHLPEMSKAVVSTLIGGKVGKFNFIEGHKVKKGQFLFNITNPDIIDIQEDFLIYKEKIAFQESEYQRQLALFEDKITTAKELSKSKSEFNTTQSRLSALEARLKVFGINADNISSQSLISSLPIRSPISGYITAINISPGAYLEPTFAALQVAGTDHMHLELAILEKDTAPLKEGQELNFRLQANPEKEYSGSIHLISRSIDADGMARVHCHLEDENSKEILPGMYATANITLDTYTADAVPKETVINMGNENFLLVMVKEDKDNYVFEKIKVSTGRSDEAYVELIQMPKIKDQILVKGGYFLLQ